MAASGNTIAGDLPPSSSVTLLRLLFVAASCTFLPPTIDPVKLTERILWCEAIDEPVTAPPVTNCTTPGGNPASAKRGPSARAPKGDFSEVLKMN